MLNKEREINIDKLWDLKQSASVSRLEERSKIDKVIYAQLEEGEDILKAVWGIAKQYNIRAGVVMEGSGILQNVVIQGLPRDPLTCALPLDIYELEGPLQANVRGVVGVTVQSDVDIKDIPIANVPGVIENDLDRWQMMGSQGGVGTPYFHSHFTFVNKEISQSGHLMPGTLVATQAVNYGIPLQYTLIIAIMKD
ncbi:MAG TPA: DUF296 domain-containing protein, partial [Syntrophomonas sp.]|nr:DUF296 domain-containing protein [Syntrophomonas sp.]